MPQAKDYVTGIFRDRTQLYGEKFRQFDGRMRALERGHGVVTSP